MHKVLAIVFASAVVCGCSGSMQGVIAGSSERPQITYQQGMDSDDLRVAMPNGEVFQGKVVHAGRMETVGFGTAVSGLDSASGTYFGTSSTGQMVGKLFSDRRRVMDCQMQYADSSGFTTAGGVGQCQIVGGERIDIVW
jgi:hypothetical protein